jgi:hypothetical protein
VDRGVVVLCTATAVSTAPAEAFFARWADMATWPEWDEALAWTALDGPFAEGTTGVLKPRRGPRARFVIEVLVPGAEFTDVSSVPGARLRIRHLTGVVTDGRTQVTIEVSLHGPLAGMWSLFVGRSVARPTPLGLSRLVEAAERDLARG